MAALVLGAAGSALGGAILPGAVGGAVMGAAGALAGGAIDAALFGPRYEGPRVEALRIQSSTEGAGIARVFGRMRVAGQVIWAARFREHANDQTRGGKGGGARVREYSYTLSFAVALCEGEIAGIGRIWADGAPFDPAGAAMRIYRGTEDQAPDALIEAIEGAGNAPAFRGVAYVVFEDLDLTPFGARLPNLSFEVLRRPLIGDGPRLESLVKGVTLIPASGEFMYATEPVERVLGPGRSASETHHSWRGASDIEAALDDLRTQLPACEAVNLIVAWFGDDLRAGHCRIRPGVETAAKETRGGTWRVNGVARADAYVVSQADGAPVYGGTPTDAAVLQAITALKARGYRITLTPFILMDVPAGNGLPDPYGAAEQAPFPWRGRITIHPAAGQPGSPDGTPAAAPQIGAFFGSAAPAHFGADGDTTVYSGPNEWGLRRIALHYAKLAQMAGGVDAFIIGTEMRGVTWARSAAGTYPAVAHLKALAADVKTMLPGAAVSYAADWSEYFDHQPADGSGDVYYHLDPLWADPNIGFVGIDWYAPLADWRDGTNHADAALAHSTHDISYLSANVEGGEGYEWFYASPADRDAQIRTPITDGHGAPWTFRYKDIRAWWGNAHVNRPGGTPEATPTAWVPRSKPIRFLETGCPAADKGANQPNVFYDPKSSESALPYYSSGARDDLVQRRYLEALLSYWAPEAGNNPASDIDGAPMLDMDNCFVWTWDARPYPDFPSRAELWSDGPNWRLGHWLTGRVGLAPLADVVREICAAAGAEADVSQLDGLVAGYVLSGPCSARDALAPLAAAYRFDLVEAAEGLRFLPRTKAATGGPLTPDDAVWRDGEPRYAIERAQAADLPREARVRFVDEARDFQSASVSARDRDAEHQRAVEAELPLTLDPEQAGALARALLADARAGAETLEMELPPSRLALEPGDTAPVTLGDATRMLRLTSATGGAARRVTMAAIADGPPLLAGPAPGGAMPAAGTASRPALAVLDLPLLPGETERQGPLAAAYADPWPGEIVLWAGAGVAELTERATTRRAATMGELVWALWPGPVGRWDDGNVFRVRLYGGALSSLDTATALAGGNLMAVESAPGAWEVLTAREAVLVEPDVYELRALLRGLAGTETAMAAPTPVGSRVVLLNGALTPVPMLDHERGATLAFGAGAAGVEPGGRTFETLEAQWLDIVRRPLSPVHLRGTREPAGVRISWTRRSRTGGDGWTAEVPLGEDAEAYAVEILAGGDAALTLETPAPQVLLAQEAAIFGGPVWSLDIRVYQVSPSWGRGAPAARTLYLTP